MLILVHTLEIIHSTSDSKSVDLKGIYEFFLRVFCQVKWKKKTTATIFFPTYTMYLGAAICIYWWFIKFYLYVTFRWHRHNKIIQQSNFSANLMQFYRKLFNKNLSSWIFSSLDRFEAVRKVTEKKCTSLTFVLRAYTAHAIRVRYR